MASAYRPCHKTNRKYHLTNWKPTLMTNQIPKYYVNSHSLPKQQENIIPALHHISSTTKLTLIKNQKPSTTKPKTINLYRYSPTTSNTSSIKLINEPNSLTTTQNIIPEQNTLHIQILPLIQNSKYTGFSHNIGTHQEMDFILNLNHTQNIVYTQNKKHNQNLTLPSHLNNQATLHTPYPTQLPQLKPHA